MRKLSLLLIGIVAFGAACLVLVGHNAAMDIQEATFEQSYLTQAQLQRLIDDQQQVAASGIFPLHTQGSDAGPLINPFVALDGGSAHMQKPLEATWWNQRTVRDQVRHRAKRGKRGRPSRHAPRAWLTKPETMPQGDLSLLTELRSTDHWNADAPEGRYAAYLATDQHPLLSKSPIPNLIDMQTLARLRLAQGLESGEMEPALQEVRHLAILAHSTENLIGSMIAVAILSIEKRGYDAAVARDLMASEEWKPASDAIRSALRRAGMSMVLVVAGWTEDADALAQLTDLEIPLFGYCGAVQEAAVLHVATSPDWTPLPFERIRSVDGSLINEAIAQQNCRLQPTRTALQRSKPLDFQTWISGTFDKGILGSAHPLQLQLLRVPFVRGPVLLHLMHDNGTGRVYRQYGTTAADDWRVRTAP